MFNNGFITWFSKRQSIVVLSSIEIEYVVLIQIVKKIIWLRFFVIEFALLTFEKQKSEINVIKSECSMNVKNNNQNVIVPINNFIYYAKNKYIDIQHHYIRNKIQRKCINFICIFIENMKIDNLIKFLFYVKFHRFFEQFNMQ